MVEPERLRPRWLLRRAFRKGNTWSLCEAQIWPSATRRMARAAKGAARIAQGVAMLPLALIRGRHAAVQALTIAAGGAGNLVGLVGFRYQEYRREGAA